MLLLGAAIVGTVAAIVFQLFPQIDMRTAAFFYEGNGVFAGKGGGIYYGASSTIADVVRLTLYIFFVAFCTLAACGLGMSVLRRRPSLGLAAPKWLFLATCLAIGPGVVSNAILKDNWGRARPVHLVEFGGTKTFTPPLVPSKQCHRNCSFVAGEASMAYAAFFAAAFLFTGISGRLILAGVLGGLFSGLVRMSQGAHFLSDVIFAGVVMAATVAGIYLLFDWISRTGGTGPKTGPPNFLSRWCSW
ncbi:phosphatase PAP2 family protein [Hyphomicrobium sp.]|uniref:phosphatase PAP2 family protein n=1 Tax=Hyphomicrobium sp. TaxID=82 RepID=UPI002D782F36|nr:phosphatase PAP2 family protein [Hyphomicrobium sp.]HET6390961.1 phosphatase PAP2 family protein [Hyphomicrobium sp.]